MWVYSGEWIDPERVMMPMTREQVERAAQQERRAAWDELHPRCESCGQFLRKRRSPGLLESEYIGHYVQDYFGEWDHV